jgi:hypothetical protein
MLKAEIFWDPPKGEFTRYHLLIDHLDGSSSCRLGSSEGGRPSSPVKSSRLDSIVLENTE